MIWGKGNQWINYQTDWKGREGHIPDQSGRGRGAVNLGPWISPPLHGKSP